MDMLEDNGFGEIQKIHETGSEENSINEYVNNSAGHVLAEDK